MSHERDHEGGGALPPVPSARCITPAPEDFEVRTPLGRMLWPLGWLVIGAVLSGLLWVQGWPQINH